MPLPKRLAVDVDGTVTRPKETPGSFDVTEFTELLPGAKETLAKLQREGWQIILHSCRGTPSLNPELGAAGLRTNLALWADEVGLPYDDIWVGKGKPMADLYVDDRAVEFKDWPEAYERINRRHAELVAQTAGEAQPAD